jgi:hypothetical protein
VDRRPPALSCPGRLTSVVNWSSIGRTQTSTIYGSRQDPLVTDLMEVSSMRKSFTTAGAFATTVTLFVMLAVGAAASFIGPGG